MSHRGGPRGAAEILNNARNIPLRPSAALGGEYPTPSPARAEAGSGAAALAAGAWQLALAWCARRWLSGVLVARDEGVWIDAGATRFVLGPVPRGCADGDVLTLPSVRVDEAAAGPYRSGVPRGHAPEVWRVDGELLARRLAARGGAMIGWAFLSALWMAL